MSEPGLERPLNPACTILTLRGYIWDTKAVPPGFRVLSL